MQWLVGGGLQLNFSGDYIDAYYTYVNPNANIPQYANAGRLHGMSRRSADLRSDLGGRESPWTRSYRRRPSTSSRFYPQYDLALRNSATLRFLAQFTYTAEMFNDSLNTPQLRRPATRNLDASIHYVSPNDLYDFAVGGTNLTNDRYVTAGSPNYGAGEVGGYFNPPRMWYASLRVNLGAH